MVISVFFFFFQAEDGIRDHCVTGVQTCALPIYADDADEVGRRRHESRQEGVEAECLDDLRQEEAEAVIGRDRAKINRSEERRVGKSVDLGGGGRSKKKEKKR